MNITKDTGESAPVGDDRKNCAGSGGSMHVVHQGSSIGKAVGH